jgi:hypothetical protein
MVLTDGTRSYHTPIVKVGNTTAGKTGVWLYQIGERQEYDNFEVSRAQFAPKGLPPSPGKNEGKGLPLVLHENPGIVPAVRVPDISLLPADEYKPPRLPAPQDWVLVLERVKP